MTEYEVLEVLRSNLRIHVTNVYSSPDVYAFKVQLLLLAENADGYVVIDESDFHVPKE